MGKLLLGIIVVLVLLGIGYVIGRSTAPRDLDKNDRKELNTLRGMRDRMLVKASEHAVLGDDFAVLALGELTKTRDDHR